MPSDPIRIVSTPAMAARSRPDITLRSRCLRD